MELVGTGAEKLLLAGRLFSQRADKCVTGRESRVEDPSRGLHVHTIFLVGRGTALSVSSKKKHPLTGFRPKPKKGARKQTTTIENTRESY
jgi:hypothetical protein